MTSYIPAPDLAKRLGLKASTLSDWRKAGRGESAEQRFPRWTPTRAGIQLRAEWRKRSAA